jgi:hypothetical protein
VGGGFAANFLVVTIGMSAAMNTRTWLISAILFTCLGGPTPAQNLVEPSSGVSAIPNVAGSSATPKQSSERHVGANGKPCIAIAEIHAKSQVNTDFYEHWIRATNRCGQYIKLRVCHHGTEECIAMSVPPWESKSGLFGMSTIAAELQYEARERF